MGSCIRTSEMDAGDFRHGPQKDHSNDRPHEGSRPADNGSQSNFYGKPGPEELEGVHIKLKLGQEGPSKGG